MEIAGIAAFLAAGLLVVSLLVKSPEVKRNVRFAAAASLLLGGVWILLVQGPALLGA
ncbi:hypothetical protein [Mobilicoccus caccae]|uniref:PEP-CTERM protein-sorting domain-containing protein n=1 Tax=Mobilicoccus caccae TaxID=1859295 RepID=A0ABQ6ILG0_9MICO|nr:hypothetical protein [Mobilicoccus caccae]GMA38772.1 hypothetical protein GCM10025883_08170 [Mobilicoccus caccae]